MDCFRPDLDFNKIETPAVSSFVVEAFVAKDTQVAFARFNMTVGCSCSKAEDCVEEVAPNLNVLSVHYKGPALVQTRDSYPTRASTKVH